MADKDRNSHTPSGYEERSTQTGQTGARSGRGRQAEGSETGTRSRQEPWSGPGQGETSEREGGEERRPTYGYYYATAIRRVSQRPFRSGWSNAGSLRGRERGRSDYDEGAYAPGSYGRPGFVERSFGQGGGYGSQGAYGSQYIRGTGGQSGERLGYGRGGSDLGATGLERSRYGQTGYEGRELQDMESGAGRSRGGRGWGVGTERPRSLGVEPAREWDREEWGGGQLGMDTERRRTRWQREAPTAREIMTRDVKAVTKQSTLSNVAQIMKDENCGIVPIVDENHKLLGVVTDRDLVIRTLAEDKSPAECKVEDVMSDDVEAVTPDEELRDVIELMGDKQIRRVPVVDRDDRLVGIISMADIANRADYDADLQDALEQISSRRSFWSRLWS